MELRQLRYVLAVAEYLHFGRAAEALHLGQPAVSQQVRRLERELGVELFDRTGRTVRLTAAGVAFLPAAQETIAAADRARASVVSVPSGVLRIGTSSGLGIRLTQLLSALRSTAPDVDVRLSTGSTGSRTDDVRAGRLDAAFVRGEPASGMESVHVWDDPLVAVLPQRHPIGAAGQVDLNALRELPLRLVSHEVNAPLNDVVLGACATAGFAPARLPTSGRLEETLAMIAAGDPSWAVVYAAHAESMRPPGVVFRRVCPPLSMPTWLVMAPDAPAARLAPLLAACATERARIDHER